MPLGSIVEAVVATSDVTAAARFYSRAFQLEVLEDRPGDVLLGVGGSPAGRLRLETAVDPGLPPPELWEPGPRLLGIYSRNLERTKELVEAAGGTVGPIVTYPYAQSMRECVLRTPDGMWWTVPQVSPRRPSPALDADPDRLHGELHSAVLVVGDVDAALRLFATAGGLKVLFDGTLTGDPFDRMLGLPAAATFRLAFLASEDEAPARFELMQFSGVPDGKVAGRTLGLRRLAFACSGDSVHERLVAAGAESIGPRLVRGPDGVEIELRPVDRQSVPLNAPHPPA